MQGKQSHSILHPHFLVFPRREFVCNVLETAQKNKKVLKQNKFDHKVHSILALAVFGSGTLERQSGAKLLMTLSIKRLFLLFFQFLCPLYSKTTFYSGQRGSNTISHLAHTFGRLATPLEMIGYYARCLNYSEG